MSSVEQEHQKKHLTEEEEEEEVMLFGGAPIVPTDTTEPRSHPFSCWEDVSQECDYEEEDFSEEEKALRSVYENPPIMDKSREVLAALVKCCKGDAIAAKKVMRCMEASVWNAVLNAMRTSSARVREGKCLRAVCDTIRSMNKAHGMSSVIVDEDEMHCKAPPVLMISAGVYSMLKSECACFKEYIRCVINKALVMSAIRLRGWQKKCTPSAVREFEWYPSVTCKNVNRVLPDAWLVDQRIAIFESDGLWCVGAVDHDDMSKKAVDLFTKFVLKYRNDVNYMMRIRIANIWNETKMKKETVTTFEIFDHFIPEHVAEQFMDALKVLFSSSEKAYMLWARRYCDMHLVQSSGLFNICLTVRRSNL